MRMISSVTRAPVPVAFVLIVQVVSTSWISKAAKVSRMNGVSLIDMMKLPATVTSCAAIAT